MQNNSNNGAQGGSGNNNNSRRRFRPHSQRNQDQRRDKNPNRSQNNSAENRNRDFQGHNRHRRNHGRPLTSNQVLVKYDNLLEQHLTMRRKYYEYFNRVDERQLIKLEKNFFASIEHLRRFEASLEPWQREALEKRKTERYRLDLTYSSNHNLDPSSTKAEVSPQDISDPHFTEGQKEAFEQYKDDTEESQGSFEDYLKLKGLN